MATDHDRIVTVESTVGSLCRDVDDLEKDVSDLVKFKTKIEAMVSLSKLQLAMTLGNGCLISLVLFLRK
jgi:hypothetical protein